MKKFPSKFWPILIILLAVAIFAWPYLIRGLVPFASAYLVDFFPPWNAYYGLPVKNSAMPDVISQIYPWRKLTIESFKMGQWPLWNPYSFAGNPHLANVQSAVLHPLNFLFFILPRVDAWSVMVLLQPFLTAIFTYLFCRELKISQAGSLISSLAFGFCGFVVVWMAYGTLGWALLWLPLILYGIERSARKSSPVVFSPPPRRTTRSSFIQSGNQNPLIRLSLNIKFRIQRFMGHLGGVLTAFSTYEFFTISAPLAFSLFSGHFQTSLYVILISFLYLVFRRASGALLPFILGIGIATPQLFPSIEFYRLSPRSEIFQKGEVIPWKYLITLIAPDFFGNPVTRNDWFGHYAEWAGFIGVIPLLLAFYKVRRSLVPDKTVRKRRREVWFFVTLGILSLGLTLPTPFLDLLVRLKIPVLSTSAVSRIICLFSFSMAILAGFGFDQLKSDLVKKKFRPAFLVSTAFLIFVLGLWGILVIQKPFKPEWLLMAKRNFILPTGMVVAFGGLQVLPWLILLKRSVLQDLIVRVRIPKVFGSGISRFGFLKDRPYKITLLAILLLTIFDLLRFATKWLPFDPKEYVYPETALIKFLEGKGGVDRIFGNFGNETQTYFHLPAVEGYDPLYIKRYGELITVAGDGRISSSDRRTVYLNKNGRYTEKILNLLGVRYILHARDDDRHIWAFPFWQYPAQFKLIYQDEKHEVYENQKALPRAFLADQFEVIKEEQLIVDRLLAEDFDPSRTVVLEEAPKTPRGWALRQAQGKLPFLDSGEENKAVVSLTEYSPNRIDLAVETEQQGLLFLSDNYYPGWKAFIDGEETKIYRADYSFRAVLVPAGNHQVIFRYQPKSFRNGMIAAGSSLVMIFFLIFLKKS